jgi:Na+/melibiose symporter-like transporter
VKKFRLGWRQLLPYAAPALPLAMLGLPLNVHLPTFWAGPMGLSLGTVGLTLTLVRLLDIVFDPAVGRLSDRMIPAIRRRFGRRKPFIAIALPIGVAGGILLFFPTPGAGVLTLFLGYAALTLGWSLISLPWQAWGAELSDDYTERTRITGWRETGTLLGVLASAVLPFALGITGAAGTLHLIGWVAMLLAAPAILALLTLVGEPEQVRAEFDGGLLLAVRGAWQNAPFRRLLAAWLVNGIANGMAAALFLLLCRHILQAPDAAGPILLVYFLSGVAGVPLWTQVARRIGKHVAWCWAMLISCAAFLPVMLLGPGQVGPFLLICVVSGASLGADLALPPSMQADVVDLDELSSGQHRAGLFFAAWTMAQKAGNALAVGIAFGLLDLAGFSTEGSNGRLQLLALAALYCAVPVLLKLIAVAMVWRFPIDAAEQRRIRAAIAAR